MNEALPRKITETVDSELPRETRARDAAELIRRSGAYSSVGIYDVEDDEIVLLARSGVSLREAAVERRTTTAGVATVVPILGAESGIVIGMLDVERDGAFAEADLALLEDCAAALRPLYD